VRAAERLRLAAVGGRGDALRIGFTAVGAAAAALLLLVTGVVLAIRGEGTTAYRVQLLNENGLRVGVVAALLLLTLPVLVFTGLSSRLGSPARDRRLAALRLAGATPADVRWVVALETGLAATVGSLLGGAAFLLLRGLLDTPVRASLPTGVEGALEVEYVRAWPTDVWPHPVAAVLALALVPVGATLFGVVALRRVVLTPFGVATGGPRRAPALLPALAVLVGAVGVAVVQPLLARAGVLDYRVHALALWIFVATALVGLLFGSASVALFAGRLLSAHADSVAGIVAGRRLVANPFEATKVTASIILGVVAGAAATVLRADTLGNPQLHSATFFRQSYDLVYLAVVVGLVLACAGLFVLQAEALVSRRRSLAALVAAGTPRGVLVRATLLEVLAPLVPMVVVAAALAAGVAAGFATGAGMDEGFRVAAVPWLDLSVLVLGSVALVVVTTLLSLVTLREATRPEELRVAA
jgi:hypothetical protein